MNLTGKYALITGSSQGIGCALAEECASKGMNVVLAALKNTGLPEVAKYLTEKYNIKAEIIETDLTLPSAPKDIFKYTRDKNITITLLINNAGLDYPGRFDDSDYDKNDYIMSLNMLAVERLTHLYLPELKKQEKSYLLNVSSSAGLMPVPYKPIYSPSKVFVRYFTLILREELRKTSVSVSTLCPAGVMTNKSCQARIKIQGFKGKISSLEPQQVAKYTLKKVLKGKAVIMPGWANKLIYFLNSLIPMPIMIRITHKMFSRDEELISKMGPGCGL